MKKNLLAIGIAVLLACAPNTGTITETDTGIVGKVSYSNGSASPNAKVNLFGARDTARTSLAHTATDNNGNYDFKKLAPGSYNVYVESTDSLVAFVDSLYVPTDSEVTANATLYKGGSISAVIRMQQGHTPTSVAVQALGTQKYVNVNDWSWFTIKNLAPGEYTLRLTSTILGYAPTYRTVTITSDVADTLKDTIVMVYTDIPPVVGITAEFDPFTGIAKVTWSKTRYSELYNYLIIKDEISAIIPSTNPIAASSDTVFYDTLYRERAYDSTQPMLLTADLNYRYRVTIQNKSLNRGSPYNFADVNGKDPAGMVGVLTPAIGQRFKDSAGIVASWNKAALAAGYQVEVSKTPGFDSIVVDLVVSDSVIQLPTLGLGYYYVRVRTKNGQGVWGFWGVMRKFAVAGDLFSVEVPATQNLNVNQVLEFSDGGLLIVATTSLGDGYRFIKTDSLGSEVWRVACLSADIGTCLKVITTPDNGLLVLSKTTKNLAPNGVVMKIDQYGKLVWRREYGDSISLDRLDISCKKDNGFVLSFNGIKSFTLDSYVARTLIGDKDGKIIAIIVSDSSGSDPVYLMVQVTANDTFFVLTRKVIDSGQLNQYFLTSYNAVGEQIGSKQIEFLQPFYPNQLMVDRQGNLVLEGKSGGYSFINFSEICVIDKSLQTESHYTFNVVGDNRDFSPAFDGGYFSYWSVGGNGSMGRLKKLNSAFNLVWEINPFYGFFIPKPDGSLRVATNMTPSNSYRNNIIIYKVSSDGLSMPE
jgi:hypothetical protein